MSYRQRMATQDAAIASSKAATARKAEDSARTLAMDPAACWAAGYTQGRDDGAEGYQAAIRARSEGYGHPSAFVEGYHEGYPVGSSVWEP